MLAFGGQLFGKSCGAGRTGWSCWAWVSADCRRASAWAVSRSWLLMSGGPLAGALTLEGSCFELAAVQATDNVGFVAYLMGSSRRKPAVWSRA